MIIGVPFRAVEVCAELCRRHVNGREELGGNYRLKPNAEVCLKLIV